MSDIFDEAKLELENIKKAKIVKTAAYIFIVISIIAVISTIAYQWNKESLERKLLAESDQFLSLFDNFDQKLSAPQIDKLQDLGHQSDSGFSALSLLILAKQKYNDKQYPDFIINLEKVAGNKKFDPALRDYATLNLVNYFLSNNMTEKAQEKLSGIQIESSPYKSMLKLNLALILIKDNQKAEGIKILNNIITDPNTPDPIIKDSKAMLYIIDKMEKNA